MSGRGGSGFYWGFSGIKGAGNGLFTVRGFGMLMWIDATPNCHTSNKLINVRQTVIKLDNVVGEVVAATIDCTPCC